MLIWKIVDMSTKNQRFQFYIYIEKLTKSQRLRFYIYTNHKSVRCMEKSYKSFKISFYLKLRSIENKSYNLIGKKNY